MTVQAASMKSGLGATVIAIAQALAVAILIRTLLVQPFNIPSGSMEPTLLIGDYMLVSKFSYGYSHYALPFSPPWFSGRLLAARPSRGDVVVFRLPRDDSVDFVKRIVGLPGDRIQVIEGLLHINGEPVRRQRIAEFVGADPCGSAADQQVVHVPRWRETLPNGVSYDTLQCASYNGMPDNTPVYTVPAGHYFMMGDNREDSEDSRFSDVGFVPFENIIGRAQFVFFSVRRGAAAWQVWLWPWSVRWDRLLTSIH